MEEEKKQGNNAQLAGQQASDGKTANVDNQQNKPTEKMISLTQEQFDNLVNDRLKRQEASLLKKAGVESFEELEKRSSQAKADREELAFVKNGVDEKRYEDVKIHFKGLGKEINSQDLAELIKTHPEWQKSQKVEPKKLGAEQRQDQVKDDSEAKEKQFINDLFGTHIK